MIYGNFVSFSGVCTSLLSVHLVGVELTPEGRVWLQNNLIPAQTVWLKLIGREDDILHCLVSQSRVRRLVSETKEEMMCSFVIIKYLYTDLTLIIERLRS